MQIPPAETCLNMPTFVSRKSGVRPTQIDGVFAKSAACGSVDIEEGSKTMIESDRNQIFLEVAFRVARQSYKRKRGGVRVVVAHVPPLEVVDQQALQQLARKCTGPAPKRPRFRPSAAARVLRGMATASRRPEDWKQYQNQMRRERDEWRRDRLQKAVEGWVGYREMTKPKRGWGDSYLTNNDDTDPMEGIGKHFSGVFANKQAAAVEGNMDRLKGLLGAEPSPPFLEQDVRRAIWDGKNKKSVGPDMVPTELLKEIVSDPVSLASLTNYFNKLLRERTVPDEWSHAVVTLLPKTCSPVGPADLRPITLASHVAKAFTRLLLQRLGPALAPRGALQCAAKNRQAADAYWAVKQAAHLMRKWEGGGVLLKVDIKKAYDSINRVALGEKMVIWGRAHADETAYL